MNDNRYSILLTGEQIGLVYSLILSNAEFEEEEDSEQMYALADDIRRQVESQVC